MHRRESLHLHTLHVADTNARGELAFSSTDPSRHMGRNPRFDSEGEWKQSNIQSWS